MPSTLVYDDVATIHVFDALDDANRHRIIVLAAGFTASTSLEFHHFIPWFQQIGNVVVVDHSERSFSLNQEARLLLPYIVRDHVTEVYFVGLSLGARLATATLDALNGTAARSKVKGVVAICGLNQASDVNGPPAKLWPLMVWPITSPRFIHSQNVKGDRDNPGPKWEVKLMPHHERAVEYGEKFPPGARRAQAHAISRLRPLQPSAYTDVALVYVGTPNDQVLHADRAAAGWKVGFGSETKIVWLPKGTVRHCSLNEHPLSWAAAITGAFKTLGVTLTIESFRTTP